MVSTVLGIIVQQECVGVYRVRSSGNRILFRVEWKQNSVSSGMETEFCFEWSGNKILFRVKWKRNLVSSGNVFLFPDVFLCVRTHVPRLKLKDFAISSFPHDFPHCFVNDKENIRKLVKP